MPQPRTWPRARSSSAESALSISTIPSTWTWPSRESSGGSWRTWVRLASHLTTSSATLTSVKSSLAWLGRFRRSFMETLKVGFEFDTLFIEHFQFSQIWMTVTWYFCAEVLNNASYFIHWLPVFSPGKSGSVSSDQRRTFSSIEKHFGIDSGKRCHSRRSWRGRVSCSLNFDLKLT